MTLIMTTIDTPLPTDAPLLERTEESATLDAAVQRYLDRRDGALVTISALRGFGATRMVRHAAERLLGHAIALRNSSELRTP